MKNKKPYKIVWTKLVLAERDRWTKVM